MRRPALLMLGLAGEALMTACAPSTPQPELKFEISFPSSVRPEPVTGRAYVVISRDSTITEMDQRSLGHQPVAAGRGVPFFGADVERLSPGTAAVIDHSAIGYPAASLRDLPAGDYYVQALLNIYTEFRRADGHVVWAHEDQW